VEYYPQQDQKDWWHLVGSGATAWVGWEFFPGRSATGTASPRYGLDAATASQTKNADRSIIDFINQSFPTPLNDWLAMQTQHIREDLSDGDSGDWGYVSLGDVQLYDFRGEYHRCVLDSCWIAGRIAWI